MKHASWLPDPDTLDPERRERLRTSILRGLGPLRLPFPTMTPQPKQEAFMRIHRLQKFYGGAAGGGKSITLMLCAQRYVDIPGYSALLLRRTYPELALSGGLIDVGFQMFGGTSAKWNQTDKKWTFPSGATITFGYLQHEADKYRYKSSAFQYIGIDELTHFSKTQYLYMFSRLRRPADGLLSLVPIEMCSGSNPGGPGHEWVKELFVDPATRAPDGLFMPAKIEDNRKLDRDDYIRMLGHLPGLERDRLLLGDWDATDDGKRFWATWFQPVDQPQGAIIRQVRSWDIAATEPTSDRPEPDWTVGVKWARHPDGTATILDVVRTRVGPGKLEGVLADTAKLDGTQVTIRIEQEPGASGKLWAHDLARRVLPGHDVVIGLPVGSKDVRARPLASAAERGLVFVVRSHWTSVLLDELQRFDPYVKDQVDDQVDAASSGYSTLMSSAPATLGVPTGTIPT